MGDVADMMLEGGLCEECGVYLGDGDGYPRKCDGCTTRRPKARTSPPAPASPTSASNPCRNCGQIAKQGSSYCRPCQKAVGVYRVLVLELADVLGRYGGSHPACEGCGAKNGETRWRDQVHAEDCEIGAALKRAKAVPSV